eukprot:UN09613
MLKKFSRINFEYGSILRQTCFLKISIYDLS